MRGPITFSGQILLKVCIVNKTLASYLKRSIPSCNIQIFSALKIENFQLKKFGIFLIFAQNIDCGYTFEPPRRGGSNAEAVLTSTHNLCFEQEYEI